MARRALDATKEAVWVAGRFDDPEFYRDTLRGPKTVFVTGGTGTMGIETVKQLLSRAPRFKVRALARPSEKNRVLMSKMAHPMLEVVWGDMDSREEFVKIGLTKVFGERRIIFHPVRNIGLPLGNSQI